MERAQAIEQIGSLDFAEAHAMRNEMRRAKKMACHAV
jgi:hypothetical protein